MSDDVIRIDRRGDVAMIVLNRPAARNAVNAALASAVCDAITACQDAGAIVITGSDPAFCAGLDLRSLGVTDVSGLAPFIHAVTSSAVPTIAAVNGAAVTGGFELALACDFIIASDRASFADTHLRVNVYPGPVLVELPRRVGMAWARQMSLTGDFVAADTAMRIGIANEVVPHDQLIPRSLQLAGAIAEQPREKVVAMRRDWDASMGVPIAEARRIHRQHAVDGGFLNASASTLSSNRDAVLRRSREQRDQPPTGQ